MADPVTTDLDRHLAAQDAQSTFEDAVDEQIGDWMAELESLTGSLSPDRYDSICQALYDNAKQVVRAQQMTADRDVAYQEAA